MVRLNVVVSVTPPPVPVIVIVYVPALAAAVVLIRIAATPEPPAIEAGLKAIFTPAGCPVAERAIAELKPPEAVAVILTLPVPPGAMLAFLGVAASVKLPPPEDPTVTAKPADGMPLATT